MTLKCNLVKLWPCPEYIAKMCMHEIDRTIPDEDGGTIEHNYDFALERYLMWAESEYNWRNKAQFNHAHLNIDTHKNEVINAMRDPNLKVWME